jgi:hypothetical protein
MTHRTYALAPLALGLAAAPLAAQEPTPGHVQIPVEIYNQLVEQARSPEDPPRPVPARYALGNASIQLSVSEGGPRVSGEVRVELSVDVLEDGWVLVPVLPPGTPVDGATIGGKPVQLVPTPSGLGWVTDAKGSYAMSLVYRVDAQRSGAGFALPLPIPEAASARLAASLPGVGLDVTVIPAAGTRVTTSGQVTRVEATVPTARGVQIAWRAPVERGHVLSRARYTGRLVGDAVVWSGDLDVELFGGETAILELLPRSVTLSTLTVDGEAAPVLAEGQRFATLVKGAGRHAVRVGFETPVSRASGPPSVLVSVPEVPISRFELTLPGRKEVSVTPPTSVTATARSGATVATVHAPMASQLTFSWSEAVPEDVRAELRANATLFHAVHAEEGVLYVHSIVDYEVTRGSTNVLRLAIPAGVQVNRISEASGAVADWRIEPGRAGQPRVATVFLDRQLEKGMRLDVHYDRSLGAAGEALEVPFLQAEEAQRQRGMLALLASSDLTLDPVDESAATRVGENQLPAFVRETVEKTVAHTFKYMDRPPSFAVQPRAPDPVAARFDVQVDTLASLGEVAVTGSTTVEVDVKSGHLNELQLRLPTDVSLLNLSAPSLRAYRSEADGDGLAVFVAFTQELEGQFRVELSYERILSAAEGELEVIVEVPRSVGSEVEQGRVAVEALSAVEVRPASADQLTALDVGELPRELLLRTANPILMAYKYLHAEPPPRLALTLTRHASAQIQEAAIDRAEYRTLFTRDGLSVTTADFLVRNSRKQFLRLVLPEGSEVWSAFVDGRAEKPALAEDGEGGGAPTVLVKIVNSTEGFPVRLVYATRGPGIGALGRVRGRLPRPDILVTESRWDVYVPHDMRYGDPSTNLEAVGRGQAVSNDAMREQLARSLAGDTPNILDPLRITVPTAGIHFAFEKLYANQSDQDGWVVLPYASAAGSFLGGIASAVGAALVWLGLAVWVWRDRFPAVPSRAALGVAAAGFLTVLVSVGVHHVSAWPALLVSLALPSVWLGWKAVERRAVAPEA